MKSMGDLQVAILAIWGEIEDVTFKRSSNVSLPRMHESTRGKDNEERKAVCHLRSMWSSALCAGPFGNQRLRQANRSRKQRRPLEQTQRDGTTLPVEMPGVRVPFLDRAGVSQDKHVRWKPSWIPMS